MNVLKNFEAVFVLSASLACAAAYGLDSGAASATAPAFTAASNMQVVVVSAKRLTAEQKLQLLREERTSVADNAGKVHSI